MTSRVRQLTVTLLLAAAVAACNVPAGPLNGRASDEWTHRYALTTTGEVRIANTNGLVEVEAAEDATVVEVRAERIARATTDAGAKDLLPRIAIKEDVKPDAVSIETEKMAGIMFGATVEVRYHVRVPKNAAVRVSTTNGRIILTGLAGSVFAEATNGGISGKDLGGGSGGIDAETTNGAINIDMAAVGAGKIRAQTTNGPLTFTVPDTAKVDVQASVTNGMVNVQAANFEASERSRRRVEGRLNGGGTSINLSTTNGPVRFATRGQRDSQPALLRGRALRGR